MRIGFNGRVSDEKEIRAGFIGCGSHSFRNVYPTFQFAPVELVATCDLDIHRAQAFAAKFGAKAAYLNHHEMLEKEKLDAVFIVTNYDEKGRPRYPALATDCLEAGCHVWTEKPFAALCSDVEAVQRAAEKNKRNVMVGHKKMFFPANEKAKELMSLPDFGRTSMLTLQYPQHVPPAADIRSYMDGANVLESRRFLDHLCHPASLLVYLMGMPATLSYERTFNGAAAATFTFESGAVASLIFSHNSQRNLGMERTMVLSDSARHIVVDNNVRVFYHRTAPHHPGAGYGTDPDYYSGMPEQTSAAWEPDFSLGQLYNKGLFLLGYWGEVNEFARSILENRPVKKSGLNHALQITKIFEAFAEGPGKTVRLK